MLKNLKKIKCENLNIFGDIIRQARVEKEMTMSDLVDYVNNPFFPILVCSDIESGKVIPDCSKMIEENVLRKVCMALDIDFQKTREISEVCGKLRSLLSEML